MGRRSGKRRWRRVPVARDLWPVSGVAALDGADAVDQPTYTSGSKRSGESATVLVIETAGVVVLVVCDEHARFSTVLMGGRVRCASCGQIGVAGVA